MDQNVNVPVRNRMNQRISSLMIDKDDLLKLCRILQERADAAAILEIENYPKGAMSDQQHEDDKRKLKDAFKLHITITSKNGAELYGSIDHVFNSPNFPADVRSFYVNSETILKARHSYSPRNSFELFLDFSKAAPLDLSLLPSQDTPNGSNFTVQGYDATWANGVYHELQNQLKERTSCISFVHKHSVYDLFLIVLGLPFCFWGINKGADFIEAGPLRDLNFVKNAAYVYFFFLLLFVFRVIFHYVRWVSPLVEYKSKESRIGLHRFILGAIILSVASAAVYDFIKYIF